MHFNASKYDFNDIIRFENTVKLHFDFNSFVFQLLIAI